MAHSYMHRRDVFHSEMVAGARFEGRFDMPCIEPVQEPPERLVPFSRAMDRSCTDFDAYVHFYEDDYLFERLWNSPGRYLGRLERFAGAISPDFSTCVDFPGALKVWSTYRDRACGRWLQERGMAVIPNVRCDPDTLEWALDGLPRRGLIAIGARGNVRDRRDRERLLAMTKAAVAALEPTGIVWYGSTAYGVGERLDALGVLVYTCRGQGRGDLGGGDRVQRR